MPTHPLPTLLLEASEAHDSAHWHWRLLDAEGRFLADHPVALNPADWQYQAFIDLFGYLNRYVAPDKWREDEARIVGQVGAWIGAQVLGPVGEAILAQGTPVTVRVRIPQEPAALGLLYRPLELAHVNGQPLAVQEVSLVFEAGQPAAVRTVTAGEKLRMLAVFSLPQGASALNLRQERHRLKQLIRSIAACKKLALELRVVQYGVTRQALREILAEGEGWDLVHFSGHGLAGELILETPAGAMDRVSSDELSKLLRLARGRLKWVTLSACLSAAATVAETLRWLGLEPRRTRQVEEVASQDRPLPALAQALVEALDCAVLAMRYPVGDEFAIALGERLYRGMLDQGQSLTRALQLALSGADGESPLAIGTPALFGRRAVDLALTVPTAAAGFALKSTGLAWFPPESELFVGRVEVLTRASQALAPRSGKTGVLFHGMAGAGKTACALELAYHYEDLKRFQGFVWYRAPERGKDIDRALLDLALAMEHQLPGFKMAHVVDRAEDLDVFLPGLTHLLDRNSILIVLDNLESLLRDNGQWRDERWGRVVEALLAHRGESRTVLTSRIRPVVKLRNPHALVALSIHALSLDEAALLARQLPRLGALLRGDASHRQLVLRTLEVVQGHPKLIELAEGQATDTATLERHLERATEEWAAGGARLEAFFREGESKLEEGDFLRALAGWTEVVAGTLSPAVRELFLFLCGLEEADRESWIVQIVWPNLWKHLERVGEAPALGAALDELAAVGLVAVVAGGGSAEAKGEAEQIYGLHPGVAEAGRRLVGEAVQAAVDTELAAFWRAGFDLGRQQEAQGGGAWVVLAGQRAAPYLLRRARWAEASGLLDRVLLRDHSPATVAGLLPLLRRIAQATAGTEKGLADAGILARALGDAGRVAEAEARLREVIEQAARQGAYRWASVFTGDLISLLRASGRAAEALGLVERLPDYTRRAGLGPWTQLGDEAWRLRLLTLLGRSEEVLAAVESLRERLKALPETGDQEEAVDPWAVREFILETGHKAAKDLERWEEALALNAEVAASRQARGAPPLELARTRFNDYSPLLQLKRSAEARALLEDCRTTYEAAGHIEGLGAVFSALAELEDKLGHRARAIAFVETALRYKYLASDPEACAVGHFNLANYLVGADSPAEMALAQRLAAVLILFQTASGMLPSALQALARHLASFTTTPPPLPPDFATLCQIVERVEGVRFRELFERLPAERAADGDEALRKVLAR